MSQYQTVAIDFVDRPKAQVVQDQAYTLQAKLYLSNSQDTPSSATITIQRPGGADMPSGAIEDASVSIDGSGNMTYDLAKAQTSELGANYTAAWKVTDSNSDIRQFIQMFDVVKYPLWNPVIQTDLEKHHQDLTNVLFSGQSDYQDMIEMAFEDVYDAIEGRGFRPALVLNVDAIRRPIEHLALHKIFLARVKSPDDRWQQLANYHKERFDHWFQVMTFVYDSDEDGVASTSDTDTTSGEESQGSAPRIRI